MNIYRSIVCALLLFGLNIAHAGESSYTLALTALESGDGANVGPVGVNGGNVEIRNVASTGVFSAGKGFSIDLISAGEVVALDFEIRIEAPNGLPTEAGLSDCVSMLPKSHMGQCRYHADRGALKVVVFSVSNAGLPTGPLGRIMLPSDVNARIVESSVTLSDSEGNRLPVEVL